MGGLVSYLLGGGSGGVDENDPSLDEPDSALGLTRREKRFITDCWDIVRQDLKGNGCELLILFITHNPEAQKRFASFRDVPLSELAQNAKFQAHANSVMYALTAVIDQLDDFDVMVEMLRKQGENHGRRHITEEEFLALKAATFEFLGKKLGKKLTPPCLTAWQKVADAAFGTMIGSLNEVKKSEHIIS